MLLNDSGATFFPAYERLRRYLASTPCSGRASDETIARALTVLRLTRWLTLARRRRDPRTGRIQGNLYVLHDDPLTPFEAIQLDPQYLILLCRSLTHASKAVCTVACHTVQELSEDPQLSGQALPSRLQLLAKRLADQGWSHLMPSSDSEDGESERFDPLRIPKTASTVRTVQDTSLREEVSTVPPAGSDRFILPELFSRLRPEQQAGALAALTQIHIELRQQVIDEWAARCQKSNIRNPAAYLFGIVQKALRGEFHAWAGPQTAKARNAHKSSQPLGAQPATAQPATVGPEVARQQVAKLRALLQSADTSLDSRRARSADATGITPAD